MRWAGLQANCGHRADVERRPFFIRETDRQSLSVALASMAQDKKDPPPKRDLDIEATTALEQARAMAPGPERTEAMKRAGILRNAADLQGLFFAKRGRPAKT